MKQYNISAVAIILISSVILSGCRNRDINEGEQFKPVEIHESSTFHFDFIKVDGVEYLILEKDNNNPHEGFGFMAFRANVLMEKQDSILAYLQTTLDMQNRIYSRLANASIQDITKQSQELLNFYLQKQQADLKELVKKEFKNKRVNTKEEQVK